MEPDLELVDLVPDRVECVALDHLALVLSTVCWDAYQLHLHQGAGRVVVRAHVLTRDQLR